MAKPLVEVNITSWRKNRVPAGSEYGRVLVMPGTGDHCDRPLLYWAAQALAENGWRVDRMNVRNASDDLSVVTPVINGAIDGWVERVRTEDASGRLMLIGTSLTPLTYPHVARAHQLPFALLTPVINPADFDPTDQIIPVEEDGGDVAYPGPAPLICAGTADPFYDRAKANKLTSHVHEYPDANHSIEVPGHWRRSLDYLKEVTASVAQYAATL